MHSSKVSELIPVTKQYVFEVGEEGSITPFTWSSKHRANVQQMYSKYTR